MRRVFWRSWLPEWAQFEVPRIQSSAGLKHWRDGYDESSRPIHGDILLTTNGRDFPEATKYRYRQYASFFAECYQYIPGEYALFPLDSKWDYRFTFFDQLLQYPKTHLVKLPGYWACDGKEPYTGERDKTFGMVLTRKPRKLSACDNGDIRNEFVFLLRNHPSFIYWGRGWHKDDPNYQGEHFVAFDKHFETRGLLSRCKFALALDTSLQHGFTTEKFWQALAAGCVPVYSGPASIREWMHPSGYINVADFDCVENCIQYCETMTDDEYRYKQDVGRRFFLADTEHSWEHCFQTIDKVLQND